MLDKYVEQVRNYIKTIPNITEEEIIRYVYLDLGQRLSFDENYKPFGNKRKRKLMYQESKFHETLEKCMETNTAICRSLAGILEYVLKQFDVIIRTVEDPLDKQKDKDNPHTFNIITTKDGKEYIVDLQEDLYLMKMHGFTRNYGITYTGNYVISRYEIEQMDRKLGYITDSNYYTDEYLYNLKFDINAIEDFKEKVQVVLENIEVYKNPNISYMDRQWYHKIVLEEIFDITDFDYEYESGRIHFVNGLKIINGIKRHYTIVTVDSKTDPDIYIYDEFKMKYKKLELIDLAKMINNGITLPPNTSIRGLGKLVSELKEEKQKQLVR